MFENKLKYERGLHTKQIESFLNPDGVLFPLRKILQNSDYQIEFRSDYFNIYYKGGNILRVKGIKKFTFEFDIKYCNNPRTKYRSQIEQILKSQNISAAIEHLYCFAFEMDGFWSVHRKKEREEQQSICLENRKDEKGIYVIDIEYAATGYGRADILAVKYNSQSGKYKIYIIEFKQGNGSISSGLKIVNNKVIATGKYGKFSAGIYKHYIDAANLVNKMKDSLLNTVRNSIFIRNLLELANFPHGGRLDTIIIDDEIEMRFVLSNYKQHNDLAHDVLARELSAVRIAEKQSDLKWDKILIPSGVYKLQV